MSDQEERRAQIIAAQAAREAATKPAGTIRKKPRANWAASPPGPAPRKFFRRRPGGPGGEAK